jgi:hypothetical protein
VSVLSACTSPWLLVVDAVAFQRMHEGHLASSLLFCKVTCSREGWRGPDKAASLVDKGELPYDVAGLVGSEQLLLSPFSPKLPLLSSTQVQFKFILKSKFSNPKSVNSSLPITSSRHFPSTGLVPLYCPSFFPALPKIQDSNSEIDLQTHYQKSNHLKCLHQTKDANPRLLRDNLVLSNKTLLPMPRASAKAPTTRTRANLKSMYVILSLLDLN